LIVTQRLHHVAVVVSDLEAAKDFYGRILGLKEIARPPFDFPGAWYDLGEGSQLHLIVHPGARAVRGTREIDGKDAHFALRVESYEETLAHLKREGVEAVGNPHSITGWAQIFCCDPDGNVIELNAEVKPA
jgi:Lactoylglutathione lyase and related lyases